MCQLLLLRTQEDCLFKSCMHKCTVNTDALAIAVDGLINPEELWIAYGNHKFPIHKVMDPMVCKTLLEIDVKDLPEIIRKYS